MVWTSGAAQAALGNGIVFQGVPGFQNVKEDRFSTTLGQTIPLANFTAAAKMGELALAEAAATERLQEEIDYRRWATEQANKQARRQALLSGGGGLAALGATFAAGSGAGRIDPRVAQLEQAQYNSSLSSFRKAGQASTANAVLAAINNISKGG